MGFRDFQWAAKGVKVKNPAFDITPSELVTALITEQGVIFNPTLEAIVDLVPSKNSF